MVNKINGWMKKKDNGTSMTKISFEQSYDTMISK